MAKYTRGVIAGSLTFLAIALSGLEARAQTAPSQGAADFWNQVRAASAIGKQNALERGNFGGAYWNNRSQQSADYLSAMYSTIASDERKKIEKERQEQLDQIQSNQEAILNGQKEPLEIRVVPETPKPTAQKDYYEDYSLILSAHEDLLESADINCRVFSRPSNLRPETLLIKSKEMQERATREREYIENVTKSPNLSFEDKRKVRTHLPLCDAYLKLGKAYESRALELKKEAELEKNPDYCMDKALAHATRASQLFEIIGSNRLDKAVFWKLGNLKEAKEELEAAEKYAQKAKTQGELSARAKEIEQVVYLTRDAANNLDIRIRSARELWDKERIANKKKGFLGRLFH